MKKRLIIFMIILFIVLMLILSFFISNDNKETTSVSKNENKKQTEEEKIEIDVDTRYAFSDGMAWILGNDGKYYAINTEGKAIFFLEESGYDTAGAVEVDEFENGYSIVEFRDNGSFYKKIFDKTGNIVFIEDANKKILSLSADNAGYILISELGEVRAVDLKSGEEKPPFKISGEKAINLKFESLGGGIFYNKSCGYINGDYGAEMLLEELDIYEYDDFLKQNFFKNLEYDCTGFVNEKALFLSNNSSHNYVVTNKGEVQELTNLFGFEIQYDDYYTDDVFNGEAFYAENDHTNEKGIYDLSGNQLVNLSQYDIEEVYNISSNGNVFAKISKDRLDNRVTIIDKDGKQLFEPINWDQVEEPEVGNEIFVFMKSIYNNKGEKLADIKQYDATNFELSEEDMITVHKTENAPNIIMYMNSKLEEIKPYYVK